MHEALDADALLSQLPTQWLGRECLVLGEVDSTNSFALARAEEGAAHGLVVAAEAQTRGRGRMQRPWHSPAGVNLYFSVVLRPPWELAAAPPLAIAAGVAIAEALAPLVPAPPELKWPNDVLLDGRKVAGVLVEAASQSGQLKHVVLGIGVNVNQREFPEEIAARATSLRLAAGRALDRTHVLAELLECLERSIDSLVRGESSAVIDRWCSFAPWLGCEVRVTQGDQSIAGTAVALERNGALRLRDAAGRERLVHCGDASGVMHWVY